MNIRMTQPPPREPGASDSQLNNGIMYGAVIAGVGSCVLRDEFDLTQTAFDIAIGAIAGGLIMSARNKTDHHGAFKGPALPAPYQKGQIETPVNTALNQANDVSPPAYTPAVTSKTPAKNKR
jgi:hypothetical protein